MRLFDDVAHQAANLLQNLNGKCPHCGATLEYKSGAKRFFGFECPKCHLTLDITTRNNNRMVWTFILIGLAFSVSVDLALLLGLWIF